MVVSLFNEKRDTIRVRSGQLLSYSQLDERNNICEIGMARTLNVSEDGILMEVHIPIPSGSILEIMLNLADEFIIAKGIVVRKQASEKMWRLALRFTQLSKNNYKKLHHYLDKKFPYTRFIF